MFHGTMHIKEIRDTTAKVHPGPWYARKIIRRISPYITWLFLRTPITANQITILMIAVGIVASALFALGGSLTTLIGALVLQLFYILDHVDGEIARCRNTCSTTGIYLDRLANYIVNPLAFIGITIGLYQQFPSLALLIFGLIASWSLLLLDLAGAALAIAVDVSLSKFLTSQELNSEITGRNDENSTLIDDEIKPLVPRFVPSVLFNLVRKVGFLWFYPAVMNIITVAAILNIFLPSLRLGSFEFNFMYSVIIVYAVTLPIMCTLMISYHTATKNPDRLFGGIKRRINVNGRDLPSSRRG